MDLRALLTDFQYQVQKRKKEFLSETLDIYMPKINAVIKSKIKSTKPISSYTDAQVGLDRWEKKLLEELE